jgi:hypothetical protein
MTGLMDKIRGILGHLGSQPGDPSEALGAPASEDCVPLPGEPTLGTALGMKVEGLAKGNVGGCDADTEPGRSD